MDSYYKKLPSPREMSTEQLFNLENLTPKEGDQKVQEVKKGIFRGIQDWAEELFLPTTSVIKKKMESHDLEALKLYNECVTGGNFRGKANEQEDLYNELRKEFSEELKFTEDAIQEELRRLFLKESSFDLKALEEKHNLKSEGLSKRERWFNVKLALLMEKTSELAQKRGFTGSLEDIEQACFRSVVEGDKLERWEQIHAFLQAIEVEEAGLRGVLNASRSQEVAIREMVQKKLDLQRNLAETLGYREGESKEAYQQRIAAMNKEFEAEGKAFNHDRLFLKLIEAPRYGGYQLVIIHRRSKSGVAGAFKEFHLAVQSHSQNKLAALHMRKSEELEISINKEQDLRDTAKRYEMQASSVTGPRRPRLEQQARKFDAKAYQCKQKREAFIGKTEREMKKEQEISKELRNASVTCVPEYEAVGKTAEGLPILFVENFDVDAFDYLWDPKRSEKQIEDFMLKAAEALDQLHQAGYVHRDIKPENIMLNVDKDGNITKLVLIDLTTVCKEDSEPNSEEQAVVGTSMFLAPEAVLTNYLRSKKADVFALGCLFFEAKYKKVDAEGNVFGCGFLEPLRDCNREDLEEFWETQDEILLRIRYLRYSGKIDREDVIGMMTELRSAEEKIDGEASTQEEKAAGNVQLAELEGKILSYFQDPVDELIFGMLQDEPDNRLDIAAVKNKLPQALHRE